MTPDEFSVDVLIVGAGPAGLMAATWMAQTGIKAMLIDKKAQRTQVGHADGVESRTLEILDSFGLAESIYRDANLTIDLCLWNELENGDIQRQAQLNNVSPGLSRYQEATYGQGKLEEIFLQFLQSHSSVEVRWNTSPVKLDILQKCTDYPVRVMIQTKQADAECTSAVVNARYVVGCDGARSWVRTRLGLKLEGDHMNESWGVIDVIPVTDFPDIRKRCIIKSKAGHMMIIPREERLVRFYVQLSPRAAALFKADYHPKTLVTIVKDILRPYIFEAPCIEWSTIYTVGQTLCPTLSKYNRVFLAGDAVHTHSPKAGKGMNVSIQDTFNLGWKLASVIKGKATPNILHTYEAERRAVAMQLIAFDKRMVMGIGEKEPTSDTIGQNGGTLRATLEEENTSQSGSQACYQPGLLVTQAWDNRRTRKGQVLESMLPHSKTNLATNIVVGARIPSAEVLCQSDSRPHHIQRLLWSTGGWYLLVFGGDILEKSQMSRLQHLGLRLGRKDSLMNRINQQSDPVGRITTYLFHCAPRDKVVLMELPQVFRPFDRKLGYDYWKVFADNQPYSEERGSAHEFYGVSAEGCMVLVRPDQHVAFIGSLKDLHEVERFLRSFMLVSIE
ncbi:Monooxygenase, FAD-binding [Penicillium griseofulvum]|uniref:Monooxygenase, FAD-binding n=1 Tax=Penicillium patulum TaxID=5078 RepID=A0A135L925_PENPA|nr:Monooxygenase, FAD-binding [Penicillium griseofulvum]KXG45467.1 Monooxygenase, FAD-binding [Penicillium griseofulvum]